MEKETKRTFDQLDTDEKVRAVLAALHEPLPKSKIFSYAGIDYASLSQHQQDVINQVFSSPDISMSMVRLREDMELEEGFELSEGSKQLIAQEIDLESINKRISDQMWQDMDGDLLFGDD